jgi:hypothetical protein
MERTSEERLSWEALLQDVAETRDLATALYEDTLRKSSVPPDPALEEEDEDRIQAS